MLNIVAVMGRLARDPEMRQTTTGKSVASFTIACDRGRKDANGQSVCDWLNIVAWDKTAEFVCKYAAMFEKIRAQRLADAAADAADAERGIKIRRDVRKYGLYKTGKS